MPTHKNKKEMNANNVKGRLETLTETVREATNGSRYCIKDVSLCVETRLKLFVLLDPRLPFEQPNTILATSLIGWVEIDIVLFWFRPIYRSEVLG